MCVALLRDYEILKALGRYVCVERVCLDKYGCFTVLSALLTV